jgi:lipoate-protein ligase A
MASFRLLDERCDDGATNMACDEALLQCAQVATVRLYTWSTPTVSLGYFQDHAAVVDSLGALAPVAMVRRITGGGAIWHEHEVTYCLVARLGGELPSQVRACYHRIHAAIAAALARQGAAVSLAAEGGGDRRYRTEPRCFASPAVDDLTRAGGKALGSAARQRGERLLMHGSLKLASNAWDGAATAPCGVSPEAARRALIEGIGAAMGGEPQRGDLTAEERAALADIRAGRYGGERWVRERVGPRP